VCGLHPNLNAPPVVLAACLSQAVRGRGRASRVSHACLFLVRSMQDMLLATWLPVHMIVPLVR
jgi:hypothetical protein